MTDEMKSEVVDLLAPYVTLVVVDGKLGPFGGVRWFDEKQIRDGLSVVDPAGKARTPLPNDDIPADLTNMMRMMKPVLGAMLGPMGENAHFYFFPGDGEKGDEAAAKKPFVDAAKGKGHLTVKVADEAFRFRLPLGALLVPKQCPDCGETMSGAWKFCPWHGKPLREVDAAGKSDKAEKPAEDKK